MKDLERQMFRHFIYSRVNEYYMFKEYRLQPGQTYKEFRLNMTADYMNLAGKNRWFVHVFLNTIYHCETWISFLIIIIRFLNGVGRSLLTNQQSVVGKELILNVPYQKVKKLFKDANISTSNILVVDSPYLKNDLFDSGFGEKISLYSGVTLKDVWCSFLLSCRMAFFIKRKYGYRDCIFRAYSSFDYFLAYCFFTKLDKSNIVYFPAINDRWTYLFGHLRCKTVFLQHGGLNRSKVLFIMSKVGKADVAYFINESQRDICNRYMFSNIPKAHYFAQMEFTSNDKLLNNGNKDVLLACELIYFETEKRIIEEISTNSHLNLYVKPHPQNSIEKYVALQEKHGFVMLGKTDFPRMDYVISYDSTLILEYQSKGVKTLMYEDVDYQEEYQKLLYL